MIEEQVKAANTPDEMRVELFRLRHYSPMVGNIANACDGSGLSGEDRYTMIAYHSLKELQYLKQFVLDDAIFQMSPSVTLCTELLTALRVLLDSYIVLSKNGDFGLLNAEEQIEVITARKAIANAKKRQLKAGDVKRYGAVGDGGIPCQNCFKREATMQAGDGEYICSSCWQKKQDE